MSSRSRGHDRFDVYGYTCTPEANYKGGQHSFGVKVSNIPSRFPTDMLCQLFLKYGQCDVRLGDNSTRSRAETPHYYAYVNFFSLPSARAAVSGMNGYQIGDMRLNVKLQGPDSSVVSLPPSAAPSTQTCTVKVANIPKLMTESDLTDMFSFGRTIDIASLRLIQTQAESNYAYVNYTSSDGADRAIDLHGCVVRGSKLTVKHHGKGGQSTAVPTSSGTSVKVLITEGSVDDTELYNFFCQFGELRNVPKIKLGSPNFAYLNYTNSADAKKVSQYPSVQIKPGVTVKIRPPSESPIPVTPTALAKPYQSRPKAPLCVTKKIQCTAVIAQVLTSSDPKYIKYQQSIAPATISREKNGSGLVLFGANSSLPAAESLVRAIISELQHEYTETVIELPCMYIPAFCNQALVNSLSDIEQKCLVRFHVCITPQCTQDIVSFSKLVSGKLSSSTAAEVSSLSVTLHQRDPADTLLGVSKPANYEWFFKDKHHSYTHYDPATCAQLNKHYSSSPLGSVQLCITTKLGATQYFIDFAAMTQTNIKTGKVRKMKKSVDNSSSFLPTWLYEDDSRKMVPYSASECIEIERMYLSNTLTPLVINGKTYNFDFLRMKQINTSFLYECNIERQSPSSTPTQETFFKMQISGLKDRFKEAEDKLVEDMDNAVVKQTHPLPKSADSAFQTKMLQMLCKYFVKADIVRGIVEVQGVQGYIEKVTLIVREKILEFEKECIARAPVTSHSTSVPPTWEPQTDNFDIKEVSQFLPEWKEVEDKVHKTLSFLRIKSIKRIQNKWQWDRYSFAKQRMSERNGGVINELSLFHGTGTTPPEKIYKSEQGFDFRFSHKGMWGTGTYFAINASYSDRYCYRSTQGKQMILALVLTGETCRCKPDGSLKKPPIKPRKSGSFEDELYDSVSGHTSGSDVYIIYDHEKAYPCYLITYEITNFMY